MDIFNLTLHRSKEMVDLTPSEFQDVCNSNNSLRVGNVTLFLENEKDSISVAFVNPEATLENRLMMSRVYSLKRKIKILVEDGDYICLTKDKTPMLQPGSTTTYNTALYRISVTPTRSGSNRMTTQLKLVSTLPAGVRLTEIMPSCKSMMQQSFSRMVESVFGKDLVCNPNSKMGGVPSIRFYAVNDEIKPYDAMLTPGTNLTYGYKIDNGELSFSILTLSEAESNMRYPGTSKYDGLAQFSLRSHNVWFWSFTDATAELDALIMQRLTGTQLMSHVETERLSTLTRKTIFVSVYPDPNLIHIV